jgi:hypothetical protein
VKFGRVCGITPPLDFLRRAGGKSVSDTPFPIIADGVLSDIGIQIKKRTNATKFQPVVNERLLSFEHAK